MARPVRTAGFWPWKLLLAVVALTLALALAWAWPPALAAGQIQPPPERQVELVRLVRQDCGSCHGLRLTGGLGPALTPQALAGKPAGSLAAAIVHGRPGTPMPPWRALLGEAEAWWIAERLLAGFPEGDAGRPAR